MGKWKFAKFPLRWNLRLFVLYSDRLCLYYCIYGLTLRVITSSPDFYVLCHAQGTDDLDNILSTLWSYHSLNQYSVIKHIMETIGIQMCSNTNVSSAVIWSQLGCPIQFILIALYYGWYYTWPNHKIRSLNSVCVCFCIHIIEYQWIQDF